VIHNARSQAQHFQGIYDSYLHSVKKKKIINEMEVIAKIDQVADDLNSTYTLLVDLIQPRIGVD